MNARYIGLIRVVAMSLATLAAIIPARADSQTALVDDVRKATSRFRNVAVAQAEGYAPFLGCVSGPDTGAMGIHYVNGDLVGDGVLDPQQPEALLYESNNGQLTLLGVEYVVLADAWNANNPSPPALDGQVFHYVSSPNRFGLPAFYALHVWAWRNNPNGMFADWNPKVSCEAFTQANPHSSHH